MTKTSYSSAKSCVIDIETGKVLGAGKGLEMKGAIKCDSMLEAKTYQIFLKYFFPSEIKRNVTVLVRPAIVPFKAQYTKIDWYVKRQGLKPFELYIECKGEWVKGSPKQDELKSRLANVAYFSPNVWSSLMLVSTTSYHLFRERLGVASLATFEKYINELVGDKQY